MSDVIDQILLEVSLDDRVSGIFLMENNDHMDALREYLIEHGIPKQEVLEMTNAMLEGNYPERQAFQKDTGILVTWPSPEYKAKAFKENPGKYTDQDPNPKKDAPPEPTEKPLPTPQPNIPNSTQQPKEEPAPVEKTPNIFHPEQQLKVEPIGQQPAQPQDHKPIQPLPKTPEQLAAEKKYINKIFDTDNTNLSNIIPVLNENFQSQLKILHEKANELNLTDAASFIKQYLI